MCPNLLSDATEGCDNSSAPCLECAENAGLSSGATTLCSLLDALGDKENFAPSCQVIFATWSSKQRTHTTLMPMLH